MKYNDKQTRLLSVKYDNRIVKEVDYFDQFLKKRLKEFSKRVIKSGIDKDWWGLVSKEQKMTLMNEYFFQADRHATIYSEKSIANFITNNKSNIIVDMRIFRDIKISRVLR